MLAFKNDLEVHARTFLIYFCFSFAHLHFCSINFRQVFFETLVLFKFHNTEHLSEHQQLQLHICILDFQKNYKILEAHSLKIPGIQQFCLIHVIKNICEKLFSFAWLSSAFTIFKLIDKVVMIHTLQLFE